MRFVIEVEEKHLDTISLKGKLRNILKLLGAKEVK